MKMKSKKLLERNRLWAKEKNQQYFQELSNGQKPSFLWVGCSDSRVPPELITGSDLGEIFVHRNIANQVRLDDVNLQSVIQYSVEVLQIKGIIVCGHYGCGGVNASFNQDNGLAFVDQWIAPIRGLLESNQEAVEKSADKSKALVELNVLRQVSQLESSETIKKFWESEKRPEIFGWVFDFSNGYLKQLSHKTPL
jgi:carbonic anhydrase